jgi:hypothetical protein
MGILRPRSEEIKGVETGSKDEAPGDAWTAGGPNQRDDGFAKIPSAALRFILALLNSRGARRRSRFNRVNHCSVLLCTPHSSRFARLASGAFCCAVYLGDFLRSHQGGETKTKEVKQWTP